MDKILENINVKALIKFMKHLMKFCDDNKI